MAKSHDIVAKRIAENMNVFYNAGRGPDIHKYPKVVEVVMAHEVDKGIQKINGFQGPTYIAGATQLAVERAKKATRGTSIGVIDQLGRIVKRSTR